MSIKRMNRIENLLASKTIFLAEIKERGVDRYLVTTETEMTDAIKTIISATFRSAWDIEFRSEYIFVMTSKKSQARSA